MMNKEESNLLTDCQHKITRILYNYAFDRRLFPTIHELMVKIRRNRIDFKTEEILEWAVKSSRFIRI
ncbi:hypothetical protein J2W91_004676 [Paenibacillus amylolyticus]|uniref:Uncharacterized protein n=1 Tax=Paenibacillus amylolyticus TaxID=1451 RepID=A0AAP5LQY9_PAEAM|nr:hypothetical protein [Paenibacillus amylolyticus]